MCLHELYASNFNKRILFLGLGILLGCESGIGNGEEDKEDRLSWHFFFFFKYLEMCTLNFK